VAGAGVASTKLLSSMKSYQQEEETSRT